MTTAIFELDGELRTDLGKGASRRLRRTQDQIPAIIYGGDEAPTPITLDHKKVLHAIENEAFYSHILTLKINKKSVKAVLKDLHRHPHKRAVLHMDFQRVKSSDVITMRIPLHFIGEDQCPGVKEGGIIARQLIDIEIRCKASDLPEFVEIDLSNTQLDQVIHLSDITLPKGVEIPALAYDGDHDYPVVAVNIPRAVQADEDAPQEATDDDKKEGDDANKQDKPAA